MSNEGKDLRSLATAALTVIVSVSQQNLRNGLPGTSPKISRTSLNRLAEDARLMNPCRNCGSYKAVRAVYEERYGDLMAQSWTDAVNLFDRLINPAA